LLMTESSLIESHNGNARDPRPGRCWNDAGCFISIVAHGSSLTAIRMMPGRELRHVLQDPQQELPVLVHRIDEDLLVR